MSTTPASPKKKDLQDRIASLEVQVVSLQDELGHKAIQLGEAEEEIDKMVRESFGNPEFDTSPEVEHEANLYLAELIEGLANQFMWTLSMFSSIQLYHGGNPDIEDALNEQLLSGTQSFCEGYHAGSFHVENLLQTARNSDLEPDPDLISMLTDLFNQGPTDQEVPDDLFDEDGEQ